METTLAKPLSGPELIEAILHDIRVALAVDDRFAPHAAYNAFSFSAALSIRLPGSHLTAGGFDRSLGGGRGPAQLDADTVPVLAVIERPVQPPNEVRLQTDQPVPVLVTNPEGGTEEKWKSYAGRDTKGKLNLPPGGGKRKVLSGPSAAVPVPAPDTSDGA